MSDALSIVDLARRTGEPVELLREWRELGLISAPGQERFGPEYNRVASTSESRR